MSSIGKHIGAVIPELTRAKVVSEREYEIVDAGTRKGTGQQVRERRLDLDGDGKADVLAERFTDLKTGRFADRYTFENSTRVNHDTVIFKADSAGVVRSEYHRDGDRSVNLWDSNSDGKLDGKSVSPGDGTLVQRDDSNNDGTIDRERTINRDGTISQRAIVTDPFFEDET